MTMITTEIILLHSLYQFQLERWSLYHRLNITSITWGLLDVCLYAILDTQLRNQFATQGYLLVGRWRLIDLTWGAKRWCGKQVNGGNWQTNDLAYRFHLPSIHPRIHFHRFYLTLFSHKKTSTIYISFQK